MKFKIKMCFLVSVSVLAGCASNMKYVGNTLAGEELRRDTSRQILMSAKVHAKCEKVDEIETQTIKINPVGTTGDSEATRRYGNVEELWTVSLCGQRLPFKVKFTPDGEGGTYFSTTLEKR